jgi:hypothetical protein
MVSIIGGVPGAGGLVVVELRSPGIIPQSVVVEKRYRLAALSPAAGHRYHRRLFAVVIYLETPA